MRKILLSVMLMLVSGGWLILSAQNVLLERTIVVTDTIVDEGVTVYVSSDDAEQENDEMDTLHDDDIDAGWEGDPEDLNILTAGLRFQHITIPAGAIIDSAFVVVCSHEGKDAEDLARITIVAEASDHPATFTMDALLTDRPQSAASVMWEVAEEWTLWGFYRTPDIKALIQEQVNRQGWQAGNAIALLFKGEDQGVSEVDNAREWEAFENIADPEDGGDGQNHPERVPKLMVYYSMPQNMIEVAIVVTDTIEDEGVTVYVSSDDAEQENDEMDTLHDDDIDAGWEGDPEDLNILTAGMRFQNLAIPVGSRIDSAFIVVSSHEGKDAEDVAHITISAHAHANAPTFTMDALITDREATRSSVRWVVDEVWDLWGTYRTPDLSAVVQEIVDMDGWAAGNAIAFMLAGEDQGVSEVDNAREWEAFENIADPEDGGDGQNHPERVPKLVVYFTQAVGVSDQLEEVSSAWTVYPNPSSDGMFTIDFDSRESAELVIFSLSGEQVFRQSVQHESSIRMDLSHLPKGLYFLKAAREGAVLTHKLIIH